MQALSTIFIILLHNLGLSKYRDTKCNFLFGLTGGTVDLIIGGGCFIDMTAVRAQELKEIASML